MIRALSSSLQFRRWPAPVKTQIRRTAQAASIPNLTVQTNEDSQTTPSSGPEKRLQSLWKRRRSNAAVGHLFRRSALHCDLVQISRAHVPEQEKKRSPMAQQNR